MDGTWKTEEFNRFIMVCWKYGHEGYVAIVCLARYAGLRIHECFGLDTTTAEQAIKAMMLTVKGKGGKLRTVPVNDSIRIELEKILAETKRGRKLFVPVDSQTHTEIERLQQFIIVHRPEFQAEGRTYPLHAHGLRHTSASAKLRISNGDLKAVQGDGGWNTPDMVTKRYAHILDEDRKNLADAMESSFYSPVKKQEPDSEVQIDALLQLIQTNPELLKKVVQSVQFANNA